jgi:hypothetical protein
MRKLTTKTARDMQSARKTRAGGRPKKPTHCPKCRQLCPGARLANVHCS